MTDRECFELMLKYGGEKSLIMIKEMIHTAGEEVCANTMVKTYTDAFGGKVSEEFKDFLRRGVAYVANQMQSDIN